MADFPSTALVTDILSGEDGPHPADWPRWSTRYGYLMTGPHDTPTHRAYFKRMRELWDQQRGPMT